MQVDRGGASAGGVDSQLARGALKLPAVLMQAITHIAPAIGVITSLAFITSVAGITSPIAFVIGGTICLGVAVGLTQLAKHIGGAGGYFLYLSRAVGPRTGFFASWVYFLYDPLAYGMLLAWFGGILHDTLQAEYGWGPPWWVTFFVGLTIITVLITRGVALSGRILVILGLAEIILVLALAVSGLVHPGSGGINLTPFNPGNSSSISGLYLGVVFTILSFSGFESVAPMAEETENPKRNLPRAIIYSVLAMIAFYIFAIWGVLIGWGTNDVAGFVSSPDPFFALAHSLWGSLWVLMLLALLNSTIGNCLATGNASTRVFFAMGRTGVLPERLGHVHSKFRTPTVAIGLQTVLAVLVGIGLGMWIGPTNTFGFVGITLTLGLILVYSLGNIGVFVFYRREHRGEFNLFLHALIPLATTVALLWVGWKSIQGLSFLSPQGYMDWIPAIVAVWIVAGIVLMIILSRNKETAWLQKAGQSVADFEVERVYVDVPHPDAQ